MAGHVSCISLLFLTPCLIPISCLRVISSYSYSFRFCKEGKLPCGSVTHENPGEVSSKTSGKLNNRTSQGWSDFQNAPLKE